MTKKFPPRRDPPDPQIRINELAALPRIALVDCSTRERRIRLLEDMALNFSDELEEAKKLKDPHWWRWHDRLDDVLSLLEAIKSEA